MEKPFIKDNRFWLCTIAIIIIPNMLEVIFFRLFNMQFENPIWYEVIETTAILTLAIPIFIFLFKKVNRYENELEFQLMENEKAIAEIGLKNLELSYSAANDYLTDLPNRAQLFNTLDRIITTSQFEKTGIFFIDLDRFKVINDTMGHLYGDIFIKLVSKRLRNRLSDDIMLYRHGGDEFIILAPHSDLTEYEKIAKEVVDAFNEPFSISGDEIFTTVSVGISIYPDHGKNTETLLKNADKAMYSAKEEGGNTYCFYSSKEAEGDIRKMKLENGLRTAIENEQLTLHYQPVVDLQTSKIIAVEALLRWEHPELGFLSPIEFIPIAEKTGAIIPIGKWVLETACRQVKQWQAIGFHDLSVAVNASIRQVNEKGFPMAVENILHETQLNPGFLDIEITESLMQNDTISGVVFKQLKAIGVKISIDDFGTGYSSLSVLSYLPIDRLKIDRSFVKDMLEHSKTDSIVRTIIDMGNHLDMKLVAEGIEEEEQREALRQYGCHFGQGYLISRPLPARELEVLLREQK